jgi:hypothetical protein
MQAECSGLPWPYDAPGDNAQQRNGVIGLIRSQYSASTSAPELDTMTSPAARSLTTNSRSIGFEELVRWIAESNGGRQIVAIAGPPGSGKSTLAERLVARLNESAKGSAALPMDGYHYDDCILIERGLSARKGAPESFDVLGLFHMSIASGATGRMRSRSPCSTAISKYRAQARARYHALSAL